MRTVVILNFIAVFAFLLAGILYFIGQNTSMGAAFIAIACANLTSAMLNLKRYRNTKK